VGRTPANLDRKSSGLPAKPGSFFPQSSALIAPLLLLAFALYQGLGTNNARDFFIYRLGAELAARGENPYEVPRVRQHVAAAFPDEDAKEFVANCGYFLPPLALMEFLPLAAMPMVAAKVCWAILIGIAGLFVARLPETARIAEAPVRGFLPRLLVPFFLVLNPLVLAVVVVGQVSFFSLGCVAAGLWCLDRGRCYLTAILWAIPFMKPHLALPLIPLLWFLAGWRPALLLAALVLGLNIAGAILVGGSPRFLLDYLELLSDSHKSVAYNRIETNKRITSWNRLLFTAGGPLVELNGMTTIAGYMVWFGLAIGRVALLGSRPAISWAVAVAAVGSVLCAQVLVYELLILTLLVPWVRDLFSRGFRLQAWLAIGLMCAPLIPWTAIEWTGFVFPPSLGVALLALLVLVGPIGNGGFRVVESGNEA
jgi:Glycosyltransferase family 87